MPTSPPPPDPYKTLGVAKDATITAVRSAYRKLVLQSHPDKFPDETIKAQKAEEFHRVQQAYEILSDDKARERYDAQVRLAELKAERFREEANSPRRQDPPYSPRPSTERVWTSQPIFEEIRPKRHYEDHPPPPSSSRPEPRYEEYRYRYDDLDDPIPLHGTTKKAGSFRSEVRNDDTPNRVRNRWKAATSKITTEKTREKEHERRTRDKTRREDGQSKRQHNNRPSFDDESGSETDPETHAFMNSSRGSHRKESLRSYDEDKHHSRRKHGSRTSSPDRETKVNHNLDFAKDHIAKTSGSQATTTRRSSVGRGQSSNQLPQAPPPQAPSAPVEEVSRSSASRRGATSKSSSKAKIEIVEAAREAARARDYPVESRMPDLKSSMTSPAGLKPPSRASTMDTRGSEPSRATIRRSATSPLAATVSASHSQKPSRLAHESGYSSPGTPDNQSSRSKTTSYKVVHMEPGSDSDSPSPHVLVIDPDHRRPQPTREQSLHSVSHRATGSSTSARHVAGRSHTDEQALHRHRPATLGRQATDRGGALYGELRSSPEYTNIQETRRFNKGDIHYAEYRGHSPPDHNPRHAYAQSRSRTSVPIRAGGRA